MSRIKAYRLKVPVGSKIELWTSGQSHRTDASVEHGPLGGATQEIFFSNTHLERPPGADGAAPPPDSFQAEADQFYSVLFTTEFLSGPEAPGKVRIDLTITHPDGGHPEGDPTSFELSGSSAGRPEVRIVTFETRKS